VDLVRLTDGVALFQATSQPSGSIVWRTDGTAGGTWATGIDTTGCVPGDAQPTMTGGGLAWYVVQCGEDHQLWRTDGTIAGSVQLTSLAAPRSSSTASAVGFPCAPGRSTPPAPGRGGGSIRPG